MKVIIILLALSTISAVIIAWPHRQPPHANFSPPQIWSWETLVFVIALMGWMPAPLEVSVWSSLWTLARHRQVHCHPLLKKTDLDFNIGYIGTTVIALCFLALGAIVMYGSPLNFAGNGALFAHQFVEMYVTTLGEWTRPFIMVSAFTTMFSTTLLVLDAYARVMGRIYRVVFPYHPRWDDTRVAYGAIAVFLTIGVGAILHLFPGKMFQLVDFTTTLTFLFNPVLAYMNFRVVTLPNIPKECLPPRWLRWLARAGLVFLVTFSVIFLIAKKQGA